jgi:hypothetical protein
MKITTLLLCLAFAPSVSAQDWNPATDGLSDGAVPLPAGVPAGGLWTDESPFECRPAVIAAFKEAWAMSGRGREEYEAAFRVDRTEDGYAIEFMPMTREPYQLPVQYYPKRTIAIVHTHPDTAHPTPGPGDYAAKVPNFVLSRRALYVTVPGTRKHRFVRRDWDEPCLPNI